MSDKNNLSLDTIDIINGTKIMEAAIKAGAFSVEDLVQVAPIVDRFIKFSNAIIAEHEAQQAQLAAQELGDEEGDDNE